MATPHTQRSASKTKSPPPPPRVRVVIADDHHHVLPEIHLAIRRRVLPFEGIHIVHFDAHPDLSFSSSVDAALVYKPELLYDALDDSPSGIAEFLLPLAYAGHVNRITWIKSPWANQMRAGDAMQRIAIGRKTSSSISSCDGDSDLDRLVVSCPWPHFIDDELYAPESEMDQATIKLWDLSVTELPVPVSDHPSPNHKPTPWILDVDLDFFSTWNPFRKDLEPHCDAATVTLLTEVFTRPRYRSLDAETLTTEQRIQERRDFLFNMKRVETERLYQDPVLSPSSSSAQAVFTTLASLYSADQDVALARLNEFAAFLRSVSENTELLALVWNAAPCLDLPHHESSDAELDALLTRFRDFVKKSFSSQNLPPALVTIATSVSDRFLPPHQLEIIKSRVLVILQELLGPLQVDEIEYEQ